MWRGHGKTAQREVPAFVSGLDVEADVYDEIFHQVPIEPSGKASIEPKYDGVLAV
jgi:hypothetical protein